MKTNSLFRASSILAFTLCAPGLIACGSRDLVNGRAAADNRSQALHIGPVNSVSGSYQDNTCLDPAGTGQKRVGDFWTAAVSTNPGAPAVVTKDVTCGLILQSITVQDSASTNQTASTTMPILLAASYQAMPSLFTYTDSATAMPVQFYGNANLTPADFSANFVISLIYSDSRDAATPIPISGMFATVVPSDITTGSVPAPTDTVSFGAVGYTKDAMGTIVTVTGDPTLTPGATPGLNYVIAGGACPASLVDTTTAYQGGTAIGISTPLTSSAFGLTVGQLPPTEECLIIANCDIPSNVCSYQLFDVTFN